MTFHHIGAAERFSDDAATKVEVQSIPMSVFKIDGELYAIHNVCIHKDLPMDTIGDPQLISPEVPEHEAGLTRGEVDTENRCVSCPWHYLEWDLETGYNPILDKSIPTFETKIEDGEAFVEV